MIPQSPSGSDRSESSSPAPRHRRAGARLNVVTGLACVVAIAAIWLAALQRVTFEREQAVSAALRSNSNLAIAFEQQVIRTFKAAEQVAAFVREHYLQQGTGIDLPLWVEQGVIRETMFSIVSVVDERGDIVASSRAAGQVNYSDRPFFIALRDAQHDELFVNEPVLGRVSGRWQIPMALRITRPDGSFGGVVVMSVAPASFTDFYGQADLGAVGLLELSGLDDVVLARKIGGQYRFGRDAKAAPWSRQGSASPSGGLVDAGDTLDGVRRIVSYRSVAGYPLMVAVGTAYQDELSPALQRRETYFAVASGATAVLLAFTAVLGLLLARRRADLDALLASEALFRATFNQAAMGIAHISPEGGILRANEKFCRMLGYDERELRKRTLFDLSDPANRDEVRQFFDLRLSDSAPVFSPEIEKPYRRKDGSVLWVCEALGVVADAHGTPDFLVAVTQDITARKDLEARLSHAALHDSLTDLPNRTMFVDRLDRVLESARRNSAFAAVLYVDLDGFKEVNDGFGHAAGDALLRKVARRLEDCVRGEDTVARFGGDEFGIALSALARPEDCEHVGLKVVATLSEPFELEGGCVQISASVGAAVFPSDGEATDVLLERADGAMYAAKNAGKNRFSRTHVRCLDSGAAPKELGGSQAS